MEEGRIRARNKKMTEEAQKQADLLEQRKLFEANPEQYVLQLREKILDRVRDMTERRLTEEKSAALKAAMGSRGSASSTFRISFRSLVYSSPHCIIA